jgi:hypothetical protein
MSKWTQFPYYATWSVWTIARVVSCGTDRFVVWIDIPGVSKDRIPNAHRVPIKFDTAKEAVQWIGWVEQHAPELVEVLPDKPLTQEQRELI